jgi:hypothetical protein
MEKKLNGQIISTGQRLYTILEMYLGKQSYYNIEHLKCEYQRETVENIVLQ